MPSRSSGRSYQRRPQPEAVPEVVVQRLPVYVRVLSQFEGQDTEVVRSEQLGARLQMTPAQIRKDLSYFGRFGRQGRGYSVHTLLAELRQILGLDETWNAALVGLGRLGRAVAVYPGFAPEGFRIVAAFDDSPSVAGGKVGELKIQPMAELPPAVRERNVQIGIVAVPADHAQVVIDTLVSAGIRAILNYAPVAAQVPEGVRVQNIDPVLSLQSMTYYLKS